MIFRTYLAIAIGVLTVGSAFAQPVAATSHDSEKAAIRDYKAAIAITQQKLNAIRPSDKPSKGEEKQTIAKYESDLATIKTLRADLEKAKVQRSPIEKTYEMQKAPLEKQKADIEKQQAGIEKQQAEIEKTYEMQKASLEKQKMALEKQKVALENQKADFQTRTADFEQAKAAQWALEKDLEASVKWRTDRIVDMKQRLERRANAPAPKKHVPSKEPSHAPKAPPKNEVTNHWATKPAAGAPARQLPPPTQTVAPKLQQSIRD